MTRSVLHMTERAESLKAFEHSMTALRLSIAMTRRGFTTPVLIDARAQIDYALEAPDELPAGGCEQVETFIGQNERGIDEYAVGATQIVAERAGENGGSEGREPACGRSVPID